MAVGSQTTIVLEPAAQALADATSTPPVIYELAPEAARKVLDDIQAAPVEKLPVDAEWITVPAAVGDVQVRIVRDELAGLPPAFLLVDEADVLRDEGEAYAAKLRTAGVPVTTVRYDGTVHDFMMLNPLAGTAATRAAVAQAVAMLRQAFGTAEEVEQ